MPRTIFIQGQLIDIHSTDWEWRRSINGDTDINGNQVSPGHPVLYKEADLGDGGIMDSGVRLEYVSRTEGFGPEQTQQSGKVTKPFYIVIDGIVWRGAFVVREAS